MEKKFKCKDEVIYQSGLYLGDVKPTWNYGIVNYEDEVYVHLVGGLCINKKKFGILPYEGNEHLVGTTDEPQIPLSEKEIQDAYWNNCTEKEKENLRNSYNGFLKDDETGKFILEKTCGKHNLQADSTDEEVRLEEGEWIIASDIIYALRIGSGVIGRFVGIKDRMFLKRAFERNDEYRYAIRFKDFDPSNMEETKKHILCVKNGKVVKYKD